MISKALPLLVLALFSACAGQDGTLSMPDLKLPTYGSKTGSSLASCPTAKCFTVYVAPWCGYCRAATPLILKTRAFLRGRKVTTRIIVGLDDPAPMEKYAAAFGPETFLDLNNSFQLRGVPHFYSSNASGEILKELNGYPVGVETAEQFAAVMGLP